MRKEGNEMRTPTILIILMSVMVVVFAGVALAKVINGDDNDNRLRGTQHNDTINGKGGDDFINGRKGNDKLFSGSGEDKVFGMQGNDKLFPGSGEDKVDTGPGTDFVDAVDRSKDEIVCLHGNDRVRANPGDVVNTGWPEFGPEGKCETVIREGIRVQGPFD